MNPVQVIGAGLAGCEAAWQIAEAGVPVELYEMKPHKRSPAHHTDLLAELVCSNSLKAMRIASAAGLLKEEMRRMNSLLLHVADACAVPAGGALAVDRMAFSEGVTQKVRSHPRIAVVAEEVRKLPEREIAVVATGPLTAQALSSDIQTLCGDSLSFFDAAAPVVLADSLDRDCCFQASRYDRGEDDYINLPMNKAEYEAFAAALVDAQRAPLHGVDVQNPKVYEGCMPIEVLMQRGMDAPRFGPMKPVGLRDPKTGHRPWAVVQLRAENREKTMYNLVGFQTNLKFSEQKRVFGMIPALKNAEYVRYGVMHRNTFLCAPQILQPDFSMKMRPHLFFAGQITGVEGYMESGMSGLLAGRNVVRQLQGKAALVLPGTTMSGALQRYVSGYTGKDYQPMGANFGLLPALSAPIRDKRLRYEALAQRALSDLADYLTTEESGVCAGDNG